MFACLHGAWLSPALLDYLHASCRAWSNGVPNACFLRILHIFCAPRGLAPDMRGQPDLLLKARGKREFPLLIKGFGAILADFSEKAEVFPWPLSERFTFV